MRKYTTFAWTRYTGEDFTKPLVYVKQEGGVETPVNLSGFAFELRFPASSGIGTIIASIDNAAQGELSFSILAETAIGAAGDILEAQIWRTSPTSDVEHFVSGTLKIADGFNA